MSEIQLRPYQQEFIDNVRNEFLHGQKRVVGVAPCGAGKTIITGWMIRQALQRGKRSLFFVHRHELIEQTANTFDKLNIPYGIIAAGVKPDYKMPVQIAAVQTLARRLNVVQQPDFLICDECHHILAATYQKILEKFPQAYLLGVTATPQRMGGITLCDAFDSMVESVSVNQLIRLGNLTKFQYITACPKLNLANVKLRMGEYDNQQLADIMITGKRIDCVVSAYQKYIPGKSAICYCVNVVHSKALARSFNYHNISAAHVDGETPKDERAALVEQFRRGDIQILCNAELFGEGFDVPNCQGVILARPTHSLTLFIQQSMRAMRPDPNDPQKVAVIIDCVNNYKEHGFPDDNRLWSLEPNKNVPVTKTKPYKTCPECKNDLPLKTKICPFCGHEFKSKEEELLETEAEAFPLKLNDGSNDENKSSETVKRAFTRPEQFLAVAKERQYKIGWVAFQSLKYAKSQEDCEHIAEICGYAPGWAYYKWQELCRI